MTKSATAEVIKLGGDTPTNGGESVYNASLPYTATVRIKGVSDYLFHRWNVEAVEAKAKAAKGSAAKKSDNIESYVYRTDDGQLAIPGEQLRMAVINAAKYRQDPRSPRKSAMDLFKAGVVVLTPLSSVGKKEWDYLHKCRVVVQRNGITRTRPALKAGWEVEFDFLCNLPEYVDPAVLNEVIANAGRLLGIGDFRPTYGRFQVVSFQVR